MKYTFTVALAFILFSFAHAQDEIIVRIADANTENYQFFDKSQDEITAFRLDEYLDVFISKERYNELLAQGWDMEITQTSEKNIEHLSASKDIEGYHTYDEALAYLQQIANDYPEICTLTDIADSHGKEYFNSGVTGYEDYQHDIWLLKISDNVNVNEDEPGVYLMGAHHSREPISTEVVLGIIEHLTSNYGNDDAITAMVDNSEIYIVPMVNPDGHEVVLNQLNTWWRKSVADNNGDGQFNYNSNGPDGVDPNRNYGWNWSGAGSSSDPTDDIYHGPSAFSEPGVAAMRDLMAAHHFTTGISYHSYSELVLYPYGYSSSCVAPDEDALRELAVNMGESIPKITGSGHYFPEQSNDLYPASGVTDDWAYGEHGIFCFTVELAQEFIPPASQVPTIVSDNIEAALMVVDRANKKILRGHIYDADTQEPIIGEIFIEGIDNTGDFRKPYKSSENFGSYYRLLTSGDYTVTFSAYGYIPQTVNNIEILENEATFLDVFLEKAASGTIIGSVLDGETGLNIEGVEIEFLDTPVDPVFTNGEGVYTVDLAFGTYTVKLTKEGYAPLFIERALSADQSSTNFVLLTANAITFEEGQIPEGFSMQGNADWQIDDNQVYEGDYSVASGAINHNQSTTLVLNSEDRAAGTISFFTKISTEGSYDFLKFYVDGEEQKNWSGEVNWEEYMVNVTEGEHEYKWTYAKDQGVESGSDKCWVDFIQLPPIATTVVNAGPDFMVQIPNDVNLNAFADHYETISWTCNGDGVFTETNILNPIYTPGTGDITNKFIEFSITVTGTQTMSDQLTVNIDDFVGIDSKLEVASFDLLPNPSKDMVNVRLHSPQGGNIEIYNISGLMIFEQAIIENQTDININLNRFSSGVYMVKYISLEGGIIVKRLIVRR